VGVVGGGGGAARDELLGEVDPLSFLSSEPQALLRVMIRTRATPAVTRIVFFDWAFFGGLGGGGGIRGGANWPQFVPSK
jgi:hypothetical protein